MSPAAPLARPPPFAAAEYHARLARLRAVMRERDVCAVIADECEMLHYYTGYTLGYYFEQAPRTSDFTRYFTPAADWRLEAGMVFHMYTCAAGLAFSETVLVTDGGGERLTRMPRKLYVC